MYIHTKKMVKKCGKKRLPAICQPDSCEAQMQRPHKVGFPISAAWGYSHRASFWTLFHSLKNGVSHTEGAGLSHTAYAGLSHTDFVVQEVPVETVLRFADIWTRMSIVQTVFSVQFISQIQGLFLRRRKKSCER